MGVEAVAAARERAASAGEVRCVQAASVVAVRCAQVASTGAVQLQETALGTTGHWHESRIGPTSAVLAGLMSVCLAGLATGPTSDCRVGLATDLAGVTVGVEIIGRDMVGVWVQRQ